MFNSSFSTITVSGTYSDTNASFSIDVAGKDTANVNRCVVESSLTVSGSINYNFNDSITC